MYTWALWILILQGINILALDPVPNLNYIQREVQSSSFGFSFTFFAFLVWDLDPSISQMFRYTDILNTNPLQKLGKTVRLSDWAKLSWDLTSQFIWEM